MKILAVPSKTVIVREERHSVLHTNEFSNRKNRAVRVHRALLVQHFHGSLDRVQHYDLLTQYFDMRDVTYRASKCMISAKWEALTILFSSLSESEPGLDIVPNKRPPRRTRGIWCRILLGEHPLHQIHSNTSKKYVQ